MPLNGLLYSVDWRRVRRSGEGVGGAELLTRLSEVLAAGEEHAEAAVVTTVVSAAAAATLGLLAPFNFEVVAIVVVATRALFGDDKAKERGRRGVDKKSRRR